MKRQISLVAAAAAMVVALAFPGLAAAHNRAHIVVPTGKCIVVGSEKSVTLPDGTFLDLRPETPWQVADEIGTAFAADQGNSFLQKFGCP
jgi:hypothetical protein